MKVWLNGDLAGAQNARIDPADRGFLLGDGLFETLLAHGGHVLHGAAHLGRLRQGAEYLGIPLDMSDEALLKACAELLNANALREGRAGLRLTLTRGPGPRGLALPENPRPTVLITAAKAPPPPRSFSVVTVWARRNEHGGLSRFKTLNYLENICARRQAQDQGADEAIMLNTRGFIASASAANVWITKNNSLFTPPVDDGALPGITRARVFDLANVQGISAKEESISPERLAAADEVFLTNSLIGACPAHSLDGRVLTPRLSLQVQAALVDSGEN